MHNTSRVKTTWPLFLIVLTFFVPLSGICEDANHMYAKIGVGGNSCGQFVDIKRGMQALSNTPSNNLPHAMINFMSLDSYHTWLAGYLTAVNLSTPDTYNILGAASSLGTADLDEEILWIENYCNSNPLNTFAHAVQALVAELYPKRITKIPK